MTDTTQEAAMNAFAEKHASQIRDLILSGYFDRDVKDRARALLETCGNCEHAPEQHIDGGHCEVAACRCRAYEEANLE